MNFAVAKARMPPRNIARMKFKWYSWLGTLLENVERSGTSASYSLSDRVARPTAITAALDTSKTFAFHARAKYVNDTVNMIGRCQM